MFRNKRPTPPERTGRTVRRQETVNVFSYYANRVPDAPLERQELPKKKDPARRRTLLMRTPAWLTGAVIVGCLFYISTLSTTPKIQVMNKTDRTLVRGIGDYQADVEAVMTRSAWNRSKLLINTDKVAEELKQEYPELGDVSVVLPLAGRRPIIEVSPAEPALMLGTGSGAYIVDHEGRAIVEASEVGSGTKDSLPVVQDESNLPVERGKGILPKETVSFITSVAGQLGAANIKARYILPALSNELHVQPDGQPYKIKFDIKGEGRQAAGTYLAVRQRLESEHKTPAEYIDVRVPEKAFYK